MFIDQAQAALICDVTPRRLRQLDHEDDPPPRAPDGRYPGGALIDWMLRRELRKDARGLRLFETGFERGEGSGLWRTVREVRVILGQGTVDDLWPVERRAVVAGFAQRFQAAHDADAAAAVMLAYVEQLADDGWGDLQG